MGKTTGMIREPRQMAHTPSHEAVQPNDLAFVAAAEANRISGERGVADGDDEFSLQLREFWREFARRPFGQSAKESRQCLFCPGKAANSLGRFVMDELLKLAQTLRRVVLHPGRGRKSLT